MSVGFSGITPDLDTVKVKVSADDTTENYLEGKIVAGTSITLTTLNPGANETLEIKATPAAATGALILESESSSEGNSSTTSGTFQQKLRHTTGSLTSGTQYIINYSFEHRNEDGGKAAQAQVQIGDSTTIARGWTNWNSSSGSEDYQFCSGFYIDDALSGAQNIDIDHRDAFNVPAQTGTSHIRRARISVYEVTP